MAFFTSRLAFFGNNGFISAPLFSVFKFFPLKDKSAQSKNDFCRFRELCKVIFGQTVRRFRFEHAYFCIYFSHM